jgi:hypothetical protein
MFRFSPWVEWPSDIWCLVRFFLALSVIVCVLNEGTSGWRVGWIVLHDRDNLLVDLRAAILRLTTIILGANTLAQSGSVNS